MDGARSKTIWSVSIRERIRGISALKDTFFGLFPERIELSSGADGSASFELDAELSLDFRDLGESEYENSFVGKLGVDGDVLSL